MNTKLKLAGLILVTGAALSAPVQARDVTVGAVLGAGAGAVIGAAFGGHEGAAIGGIIGAVAGASMAHSQVVVGVNSVGFPHAGQQAGGFVPVHGRAGGNYGAYPGAHQGAYGHPDYYRHDGHRGHDGYRGNQGHYGYGVPQRHEAPYGYAVPPTVVRYPAPVIIAPPQIIYRPSHPHHHRHHHPGGRGNGH
jgi:Glycine zipper 2TM domain